jgi:hypothetical protein
LAAAQPAEEHRAPDSLAAPAPAQPAAQLDPAQSQALLVEMWQRRVLSSDSRRWSPEDLELLERMRSAERFGAVRALRRRGSIAGLTVPIKKPGETTAYPRLTREGYDAWHKLRAGPCSPSTWRGAVSSTATVG